MKAIEFYKFINDNNIEYHWEKNGNTNEMDVIFFTDYWKVNRMREVLLVVDFDDEGIQCVMKDGYFAFWASDILDNHGIELTDVFELD